MTSIDALAAMILAGMVAAHGTLALDEGKHGLIGPTEETDCGAPPQLGPWTGHPLFGADVTTAEYGHDAGLDDVIAATPTIPDENSAGLSIAVAGAIVHNVGFPEDRVFWMADGNHAVRVVLSAPVAPAPEAGDSVSFTVTETANYQGCSE